MIYNLIFDLDGVLCDLKEVHRDVFISAVFDVTGLKISNEEHDNKFCGLPTKKKLDILNIRDTKSREEISKLKQLRTLDIVDGLKPDYALQETLAPFALGRWMFCASNSLRKTVELVLTKLDIIHLFDAFYGNDDVQKPKPHPEIYWKCMSYAGIFAPNTLIIEDSKVGQEAILESGAHGLIVRNRADVTYDNILRRMQELK